MRRRPPPPRATPGDDVAPRGVSIAELRRALLRFAVVVAGASAATGVIGLLVGLALGATVSRSLSVAFYGVGALTLVIGFVVGNRGPGRLTEAPSEDQTGAPHAGRRRFHWASLSERTESLNASAVFITVGIVLLALGMAFDTRYPLF